MNEIQAAEAIVKSVETMGVTGILALMCIIFVYLYIKEVRQMQQSLQEISLKIKDLLENQKEATKQFFDLLIERESRFRDK